MEYIIEGSISVKAALLGGRRSVYEILIDREKKDRNTSFIIKEAQRRGVKATLSDRETLDGTAEGKTHGGIIACVSESSFDTAETLLAVENPFIAVLEGIEDPFNFGDCLRSLYAAGATGIIVPERNWFTSVKTVMKSSAGACEYLPTAVCDDFEKMITDAKKHGIIVYCAERSDAVPMYSADFTVPLMIAVGGEMRGLSKKITANADRNIFIPYGSDFRNALSASAACAVCGFEIMRQRNYR